MGSSDQQESTGRTGSSLKSLVESELNAVRDGDALPTATSVELGSATYTKMLGKRT